jgi:hypothetical protein
MLHRLTYSETFLLTGAILMTALAGAFLFSTLSQLN